MKRPLIERFDIVRANDRWDLVCPVNANKFPKSWMADDAYRGLSVSVQHGLVMPDKSGDRTFVPEKTLPYQQPSRVPAKRTKSPHAIPLYPCESAPLMFCLPRRDGKGHKFRGTNGLNTVPLNLVGAMIPAVPHGARIKMGQKNHLGRFNLCSDFQTPPPNMDSSNRVNPNFENR